MPSITVYPASDRYIDRVNSASSYGAGYIKVGWPNERYIGFYQFNISSAGLLYKKITSVTFSFRFSDAIIQEYPTVYDYNFINLFGVYDTQSQLSSANLTYSNYLQLGTPIKQNPIAIGPSSFGQRYSFDATPLFQYYNQGDYFTILHYTYANSQSYASIGSYEIVADHSYSPLLTLNYEDAPPEPPSALSPNFNEVKNLRNPISLSWQFVQNSYLSSVSKQDKQVSSTLRYSIDNGSWNTVAIDDALNTYIFPELFFADNPNSTIRWQVCTTTENNGVGQWSDIAQFRLAGTPPEKPIPYYPIGITVKIEEIDLEWIYQSLFDTSPSRFDLRYKVDTDGWNEILHATHGETTYHLAGITTSSKIEWQVKAYGQNGDESEWSDIAIFYTAGKPPLPSIIEVTNSSRPIIKWGAKDLQVWEIEILRNNDVISTSGSNVFDGNTEYKVETFLQDGQYVCRLRVKNKHDMYSDWVERAFNVITVKPEAPYLQIIDNPEYSIVLRFSNPTGKALIYRAEIDSENYCCIYKTNEQYFDDFTVVPEQKYKYFIRAVNSNDSFADSNTDVGYTSFYETTIANTKNLSKLYVLKVNANSNPSKNISIGRNKTFFNFIGRQYPVAEVDFYKSKVFSFAFFVPAKDYDLFEEAVFSELPLLIRDRNVGKAYGYISGDIGMEYSELKGYNVSFSFVKIDYDEGIEID